MKNRFHTLWAATLTPLALGGLIALMWPRFSPWPTPEEIHYTSETEVKFGRPPSCLQRGLCDASSGSSGLKEPADAVGRFFLQEDVWGLQLVKASISAAVAQEQFDGGLFDLPQAFEVSPTLTEAIGGNYPVILPAGLYTVEETAEHYIIRFTQSR